MEANLLHLEKKIRGWMVFALLIAAALDICIHTRLMKPLVTVGGEFPGEVFSGVLTFSTLSLTVISMITGMMDTNLCGVKLRELLSFHAAPFQFPRYIKLSAVLSIIALTAFAFELCTLITVTALCTLVYTTYASMVVFHLVTDMENVHTIILAEMERKHRSSSWYEYVCRWLSDYLQALENYDIIALERYSDLLRKAAESEEQEVASAKKALTQKDVTKDWNALVADVALAGKVIAGESKNRDAIRHRLPKFLEVASENMPFYDAIEWSISKLGFSLEKEAVCQDFVKRIRFLDAQQLLQFDVAKKLKCMLEPHFLEIDLANESICVEMVRNLICNTSAGTVSEEALEECIHLMTFFTNINENAGNGMSAGMVKDLNNQANEKRGSLIISLFYDTMMFPGAPAFDEVYKKLIKHLYEAAGRKNLEAFKVAVYLFKGWCEYGKAGYVWDAARLGRSKTMAAIGEPNSIAGKNSLNEIVNGSHLDSVECYVKQAVGMANINAADLGRDDITAWTKSQIGMTEPFSEFTTIGFAYRFYLASKIPGLCGMLDANPERYDEPIFSEYRDYKFPLLEYLTEVNPGLQHICEELLGSFDRETGEIKEACMKDVLMIGEIMEAKFCTEENIRKNKDISMIPVYQAITEYLEKCKAGSVSA